IPAGYNEEWWLQDVLETLDNELREELINYLEKKCRENKEVNAWKYCRLKEVIEFLEKNYNFEFKGTINKELFNFLDKERFFDILAYYQINLNDREKRLNRKEALLIALFTNTPLHPYYTFFWDQINEKDLKTIKNYFDDNKKEDELRKEIIKKAEELKELINKKEKNNKDFEKIKELIDYFTKEIEIIYNNDLKALLEKICLIHKVKGTKIVFNLLEAVPLFFAYEIKEEDLKIAIENEKSFVHLVNELLPFKIEEKSGTFIGTRMGRPEKAKMRELKGSPDVLFVVGEQGGKMRNLIEAHKKYGYVEAEVSTFKCKKCGKIQIYRRCVYCDSKTERVYFCKNCGFVKGKIENEKIFCDKCNSELKPYSLQKIPTEPYLKTAIKKINLMDYPDLLKGVRGMSSRDKIVERLEKGIACKLAGVKKNKDGTIRYDATQAPMTHFRPKDLVYTTIEDLKKLGYTHDIYGNPLERDDQILELKPQDVILPACNVCPYPGADEIGVKMTKYMNLLLENLYEIGKIYNVKEPRDLIGQAIVGLAPHTSAGIIGRIIGFSRTQPILAHPMWHAAQRRNCFYKDTIIYLLKEKNGKKELIIEEIGSFIENLLKNKDYKEIKKEKDTILIYPKDNYYAISIDNEKKKTTLRKVKYFMKRKEEKWVKIKLASGKEFIVTLDHNVLVYKEKSFTMKKAIEIKKNDLIPTLANLPFEKNFLNDKWEKLVKYKKIDVKNLVNLSLKEEEGYLVINKSGKRNKIKKEIKLNNELMWFFGIYLAEGYIHENETTYQVVLRNFDEKIKKKIKEIIKNLGLNINFDNEGRIIISSRILVELLKELGFGEKLKNKKVPEWIFFLDNELIASFLAGYIDGDGSILVNNPKIYIYSANKKLINQISLLLVKLGIFFRLTVDKGRYGKKLLERYKELNRESKESIVYRINITAIDKDLFLEKIKDYLVAKQEKAIKALQKKAKKRISKTDKEIKIEKIGDYFIEPVLEVTITNEKEFSYSLEVDSYKKIEKVVTIQWNIVTGQCDGDETCFMLASDAFLNFSRKYLPDHNGGTMDAPIVVTVKLIPSEVDDEVHEMDIVPIYPKQLYLNAKEYKELDSVKIETIGDRLNKPEQYFGMRATHYSTTLNEANPISAYKVINDMVEKVKLQMDLAEKLVSVDEGDAASLVIEKHLYPDIKGNFRKFFTQDYRCVQCNEKYRRIPLIGYCPKCGGNIVFTISEGSVKKYLDIALELANKYNVKDYVKENLLSLKKAIDTVFKGKSEATSLNKWFKN
ncbi:MAG: LAGLIDADG family homing endonuclease, partial [Nanoarchaeota archaeon]